MPATSHRTFVAIPFPQTRPTSLIVVRNAAAAWVKDAIDAWTAVAKLPKVRCSGVPNLNVPESLRQLGQ